MAKSVRYQVYLALDHPSGLEKMLQHAASRIGHIRIVSVIWQPERPRPEGGMQNAGYTIIAEEED